MGHTSLDAFRTAKWQVRRERDTYTDSIVERWEILKDPDTRGILMRDAFSDMVRNWGPYKKVHDMFRGRVSGSTVSSIGSAVSSLLPGFKKRMVFGGISTLLGKIIGDEPGKHNDLLSSISSGLRTAAKFLRERKVEPAEAAAEVDA